jgi:hypothetical protein
MTTRQVMQQPTFSRKLDINDDRSMWKATQTVNRWNAFCDAHVERRSLIKSRWNRYRRLCGLRLK